MKAATRLIVAAATVLFALVGSRPTAEAYSTGTHQRITELAWAYLKASGLCEEIRLLSADEIEALKDECRIALTAELEGPPPRDSFSCACAKRNCALPCEIYPGMEKARCVRTCMLYGPPPDFAGPPCGDACERPYYYDAEILRDVVDAECTYRAHQQAHLSLASRCKVFEELMAEGILSVERIESVVAFYHFFEASPCPPDSYPTYDLGRNCVDSGLNAEVNLLSKAARVAMMGPKAVVGPDAPDDPDTGFPDHQYLPVVGGERGLLGLTNWLSGDAGAPVDLSGTIVGLHSGVTDLLKELITGWKVLPALEDAFETAADVGSGAVLGGTAGAALVGGGLFCVMSCILTATQYCEDCFEGLWDAVKEILDFMDEVQEGYDSLNLLTVYKGPAVADGLHNSGMLHMMSFSGDYDDIDGLVFSDSIGDFNVFGAYLLISNATAGPMLGTGPGLLALPAIDARVEWKPSKRALKNYQIRRSDDPAGNLDSVYRGRHYWERQSLFLYTFPPVDNLAYYWWHKWLQGQRDGIASSEYGLMPLGATLHAVQDITVPQHAMGVILSDHAEIESKIDKRMDPSSLWVHPGHNGEPIIDLNDPEEEKAFLERVSQYIQVLHNGVLAPNNSVLHIRELAHELYILTPKDFDADTLGPVVSENEIRKQVLPLAVAATVIVLLEAATPDISAYDAEMGLDLEEFEWEGPFPKTEVTSMTRQAADGTALPGNFLLEYPTWACATVQPRADRAIREYYTNQINGQKASEIVMAEKIRCEFQAAGLPVPSDRELDRQGTLQVALMRASGEWFLHGSTSRAERDIACILAGQSDILFPQAVQDRYQARCDGVLDSDGDGVFDQVDNCVTSPELLAKGYQVGKLGCVFQHEPLTEPEIPEICPGAIRTVSP